jgi:hypothetical protein
MASLYSSVSVANLEAKAIKDYSALDATLTDTLIESGAISPAEVYAEAYTGAAPSASSSNLVKYGIMTIAERILEFYLKIEGIENPKVPEPKMKMEKVVLGGNIYVADVVELFKIEKQNNDQTRTVWIEETP